MSDASRCAVRLRIEGRVQGVGFRAWVERSAVARGLDGWVRNRRDGGVEVVLAGPRASVDAMIAECHKGPANAQVQMVRVFDELSPVLPGFTTVSTI